MTPRTRFILASGLALNIDTIRYVDYSDIENLQLLVYHSGQAVKVTGIQAIELLMQIKPSALEGRKLRWKRRAWMVHNLVGHPMMQILALLGQYKLAMKVHDMTVPTAVGRK